MLNGYTIQLPKADNDSILKRGKEAAKLYGVRQDENAIDVLVHSNMIK